MMWRSLHHKEILLSGQGRNRWECIYSRILPFEKLKDSSGHFSYLINRFISCQVSEICGLYGLILHKWFVTSNLIGWWRSHGCSAFFRYCTVNSLVLNLWRQWRRRRWRRRTKMASTVRRIRGDRTELGADRMWGERVWGEPALGRNVWHPGIIFEELSLVDPKSRPWSWKTPVPLTTILYL